MDFIKRTDRLFLKAAFSSLGKSSLCLREKLSLFYQMEKKLFLKRKALIPCRDMYGIGGQAEGIPEGPECYRGKAEGAGKLKKPKKRIFFAPVPALVCFLFCLPVFASGGFCLSQADLLLLSHGSGDRGEAARKRKIKKLKKRVRELERGKGPIGRAKDRKDEAMDRLANSLSYDKVRMDTDLAVRKIAFYIEGKERNWEFDNCPSSSRTAGPASSTTPSASSLSTPAASAPPSPDASSAPAAPAVTPHGGSSPLTESTGAVSSDSLRLGAESVAGDEVSDAGSDAGGSSSAASAGGGEGDPLITVRKEEGDGDGTDELNKGEQGDDTADEPESGKSPFSDWTLMPDSSFLNIKKTDPIIFPGFLIPKKKLSAQKIGSKADFYAGEGFFPSFSPSFSENPRLTKVVVRNPFPAFIETFGFCSGFLSGSESVIQYGCSRVPLSLSSSRGGAKALNGLKTGASPLPSSWSVRLSVVETSSSPSKATARRSGLSSVAETEKNQTTKLKRHGSEKAPFDRWGKVSKQGIFSASEKTSFPFLPPLAGLLSRFVPSAFADGDICAPWQNPPLSRTYFKSNGRVRARAFCRKYARRGEESECRKNLKELREAFELAQKADNTLRQLSARLRDLQNEQEEEEMDRMDEEETEARGFCVDCLEEVRGAFAPSAWQRFGGGLSAAMGLGLSIVGAREARRSRRSANELLALQGFPGESGGADSLLGAFLGVPLIAGGLNDMFAQTAPEYICDPRFYNNTYMYNPYGY